MTTPTLHITKLTEPDELYRHYDGQHEPQPAVLVLDLADGELTCRYNPEIGNGVPESVWHHRTLWIDIPRLTADAANALMAEVAPVAERVLAGATISWDGHNHVGRLTADAEAALEELTDRCRPDGFHWSSDDMVSVWDADDWFSAEGREQACERLGLTAESTDADLDRMAADEEHDARGGTDAGYVLLRGARQYLAMLREDLRDQARDELEAVAKQLADLEARRDALIRQQTEWGDSSRAVGERAGLSHTHVQRIARGE